MTRRICANFFSGFRKKHLFITICIKKQYTRPFSGYTATTVYAAILVRPR